MGKMFHGKYHDDKMIDDHEGYATNRVGWGTVIFFVASAAAFAWMVWPEVKCWWRGLCG